MAKTVIINASNDSLKREASLYNQDEDLKILECKMIRCNGLKCDNCIFADDEIHDMSNKVLYVQG